LELADGNFVDKARKGMNNGVSLLLCASRLVSLSVVQMFETKPPSFVIRQMAEADYGGKERRYRWIRKIQSRGMNKD
ncbi:MAG: hypothetical protein WCT48_01490, partial [Candidatus Paceibacterota bacterium]